MAICSDCGNQAKIVCPNCGSDSLYDLWTDESEYPRKLFSTTDDFERFWAKHGQHVNYSRDAAYRLACNDGFEFGETIYLFDGGE